MRLRMRLRQDYLGVETQTATSAGHLGVEKQTATSAGHLGVEKQTATSAGHLGVETQTPEMFGLPAAVVCRFPDSNRSTRQKSLDKGGRYRSYSSKIPSAALTQGFGSLSISTFQGAFGFNRRPVTLTMFYVPASTLI